MATHTRSAMAHACSVSLRIFATLCNDLRRDETAQTGLIIPGWELRSLPAPPKSGPVQVTSRSSSLRGRISTSSVPRISKSGPNQRAAFDSPRSRRRWSGAMQHVTLTQRSSSRGRAAMSTIRLVGAAWAALETDGSPSGHVYFHLGDDSSLRAVRADGRLNSEREDSRW